jgi:hypothetical protein
MENMARFNIPLTQEEWHALTILAEQKRREPRAQAAMMIRRALEEYGLIPWRPDSHMPIDDMPAEL